MKKIRSLVILLVITLLLTGCVKYNVNMDIKKDKSMELNVTYALDTSYFGNEKTFSEEQIEKFEKQGFKVSEYSEGNMKGYTVTMKIKNIDDLSSIDATEYSLSSIEDNDSKKMFKLEKGFFKNRYTAKFVFNSSESSLKNSYNKSEDLEDSEDDTIVNKEENDDLEITDTEETNTLDSEEDYSNMMKYMDLSFSVTLPYKALSNNATSVKNDGKELVWDLSSTNNNKSIEFEFQLYRFPIGMIITIIIGGLLIIALIITVIMVINSGKKHKKQESPQEIQA